MFACRRGDDTCFNQLFDKYYRAIVTFSRRFAHRADLAEELAQEVFIKCHRARATYEPTARFTTWLYTIARNHCLNETRRPEHRYAMQQYTTGVIGSSNPSPETLVRTADLNEQAQAALAALPANQRQILLMSIVHDFSQEQIAEALGLTVGAVKTGLYRARQAMRQAIDVAA
jgi:RNA polymerase sigma-70 factor (ECF subfamily)